MNLTRANYVVHFDRWWNPAVERQAEDRTHRIGQNRTVFVTRLICQDTIEERIEQLLERKKILFQEVIDELADVNLEKVLSEEELFGLFGLTPPRRANRGSTATRDDTSRVTLATENKAEVIKPGDSFSNPLKLRQVLRACEQYIWWADRYFNERGLEELIVSVDPAAIREIRILSGPDNINERTKREFVRFQDELEQKGIVAQWRILKPFSTHDRLIISATTCFNVPSIDTVMRGQYSEILQTPNRPPFEMWWANALSLSTWPTESSRQ